MNIQLSPDLQAAVADEAQRLGVTPDRLVEQTMQERLAAQARKRPSSPAEAVAKVKRILAVARDCGVSLSNEALSSEGLYD